MFLHSRWEKAAGWVIQQSWMVRLVNLSTWRHINSTMYSGPSLWYMKLSSSYGNWIWLLWDCICLVIIIKGTKKRTSWVFSITVIRLTASLAYFSSFRGVKQPYKAALTEIIKLWYQTSVFIHNLRSLFSANLHIKVLYFCFGLYHHLRIIVFCWKLLPIGNKTKICW